jgi:hypothetical protein
MKAGEGQALDASRQHGHVISLDDGFKNAAWTTRQIVGSTGYNDKFILAIVFIDHVNELPLR